MKVLVIGSGGREHAIIDKLSTSPFVDKIYAAPGNDGMAKQAELVAIGDTDVEALVAFALEKNIDLTVVGPEVSLAAGVVDAFKAKGLRIFGPDKKAARIESSKEYAKELMKKYHIPTAKFQSFSDYDEALAYVRKKGAPIVIKYDGLAAGKGVVVALTLSEAEAALKDMLVDDKYGKDKVVIEEYLQGPEFSFLCFVDGKNVYPLELSQDHKRAFDHDEGPNTGGMGAYSPVSFITEEDKIEALEKIMKPTAAALVDDDSSFTGVLYGGLMKTKDGIKVIEFNCRFGDPETEVVLPRLESDLFVAFNKIIDHEDPKLVWDNKVCLGVVLASKGYPGSYEKMHPIHGLEKVTGKVYAMGVKIVDGQLYNYGGRVMIIVEKADSVKEARELALKDIEKIDSDNLFYRHDIGHWAI